MTEEKGGTPPEDEIEFIPEEKPDAEAPPQAPKAKSSAAERDHSQKESSGECQRALKDKNKKREAELKQLRKEMDELKDRHLRKLAEFENARKRFEREKAEFQQFALSGLLIELLDIKDNLERALQSPAMDMDGRTFREGVELIDRMFQSFLARNGVRALEMTEKRFDPNFHHAMTTEESEAVEEPEIVEELQKGYLHHDRLLRPALVKVAVPKKG